MEATLPKLTYKIFEELRKGKFICSNDSGINKRMFDVLSDEEIFQQLKDYFEPIHYFLHRSEGYFYFTRDDDAQNAERKLMKMGTLIDVIDFFKTYNAVFGVGSRFNIPAVAAECKTNKVLKNKLDQIATNRSAKNVVEQVRNMVSEIHVFLAQEDEKDESYKVLDAFHYLEEMIQNLVIEDSNEESH